MIRPFDPSADDKDELQELVVASQIYQHLDLEHQDITKEHLRELWNGAVDTHLMDKKIAYLIEGNGQTIDGFVRVQRNRKKNSLFIDDLYVKEDMRSHGLGSHLVEAAIEWGRKLGADTVELTVHRANDAGRHLYTKGGFKVVEPEYVDMEVKLN